MQRAFIAILTFSLGTAGAAPRYVCTYYDVVEYLNISSHSKLHAHILPKTNLKEPLEVKIDFMLVAILSVVEKLQTVTFYFVLNLVGPSRVFLSCDVQHDGWCRARHSFLSRNFFPQEWKNIFATWDPRDFCNISKVVLPMDTYWSPPIFILERVNGQNSNLDYMAVTHNGSFNSTQPFQATLTCGLIILKFPFDTQMCNLSIASFPYPVTDLVMKTGRTRAEMMKDSQSYFLTDGEWKFTNLSIIERIEELDDGGFSVVTYVISMERRPTLYILNLILPTCALYLLDMAVLFGPSSLEEKINFQIAIILGSSMLAVILNDILPTSSDKPPVIVVFFLGTFLLMIMAVLDTFFLLHQHHKSLRSDKVLGSFQQDVHAELATTAMNSQTTKHLAKAGAQLVNLPKVAQEKGQPDEPHWQPQEHDLFWPVLGKVLLYSHFFLSLAFFAIVSIKWSS